MHSVNRFHAMQVFIATACSLLATCCGGLTTDSSVKCNDSVLIPTVDPPSIKGSETYDAFGIVVFIPSSGELVSIFREGTTHAADIGSVVIERSTDEGTTWPNRHRLFEHPTLDSRNVAGGMLPSGDLLVFWNRYDNATKRSDAVYFARSSDTGRTFSEPTQLLDAKWTYGGLVVMPHAVGIAAAKNYAGTNVSFYVSYDDGFTWRELSAITNDEYRVLPCYELSLVWIGGSSLLGFSRNEAQKPLLRVFSPDFGQTWSIAETGLTDTQRENRLASWRNVSPWLTIDPPHPQSNTAQSAPSTRMTLWYAQRETEDPVRNWGDIRMISFDANQAIQNPASLQTTLPAYSGPSTNFGYPSVAFLDDTRFAIRFYAPDSTNKHRAQMQTARGEFLRSCLNN